MASFRKVDNRNLTNTRAYKRCSDNLERYIAQSILTGLVEKPDPPSIEQAHDIIRWANRSAR